MENSMDRFFIEDDKIRVFKHKCTYRTKTSSDGDTYVENVILLANDSNLVNNTPETFKTDYIDKHAYMEIVSIEDLDVSDIEWMDGIKIDKTYNNPLNFISYILNLGKDLYYQQLNSSIENYALDLDYRLSLIELGLN